MRRDVSTVMVPFPHGLMSTARSSLVMGTKFAVEIRNLLAAADGAAIKRGGVVTVGAALAGEAIVHVMSWLGAGSLQRLVVTDAGKIYRQSGSTWTLQRSGLNSQGVPRSVLFAGRLMLCNGLDDVLAYDGTSWSVVQRLVVEAGANLTYLAPQQFRVDSTPEVYAVGTEVQARLGTTLVSGVVSAVSQSGAQTTVTLSTSVLTNTLNQVSYAVKPPKVAFLLAAHDRLWGLGAGPLLGRSIRPEVARMRVFYTHGVNDHTAWPNPTTGVVPSVNLADKAGVPDELLAMAVQDGMTVFLGRNHVQLWTGRDPSASGDFAWAKTLPVGCFHGAAVLGLPNDLLFVGRQGVRTLSRTLQTEQLDVQDVGSELDPTLTAAVAEVSGSDAAYRRCVVFGFAHEGWFGLNFGGPTYVFQVSASGQGWVMFDGAFEALTAAHVDPEGTLWLAKSVGGAGQLFAYDRTVWDDAGAPIGVRWQGGWLSPAPRGRRWANQYVELLTAQDLAVPMTVERWVDYDRANPTVLTTEAPAPADFWDDAAWDEARWDNWVVVPPLLRDHAVGKAFGFAVSSCTTSGPLTIFGLKLHGGGER